MVVLLGVVGWLVVVGWWLGGGDGWVVVTVCSLFLFVFNIMNFNIMNFNIMNHFQPLMSCVHINLLSIFVSILSLAYGGIYHQHSIHTPSILHPCSIHTQSTSSIYPPTQSTPTRCQHHCRQVVRLLFQPQQQFQQPGPNHEHLCAGSRRRRQNDVPHPKRRRYVCCWCVLPVGGVLVVVYWLCSRCVT